MLTENKKLVNRGYEKITVSEKINSFFALPFFLSLMVILAVFTINNRNANNINYLMIAVLSCAIIYYMKDLSVALGSLIEKGDFEISVWKPVIIISLINSINCQINEK